MWEPEARGGKNFSEIDHPGKAARRVAEAGPRQFSAGFSRAGSGLRSRRATRSPERRAARWRPSVRPCLGLPSRAPSPAAPRPDEVLEDSLAEID